jgi:hypothetical protein
MLEGNLQYLQHPGVWLVATVSIGILARAFLVGFTEGTYDVAIWKLHAQGVLDNGLIGQYRGSDMLNHPPLACWMVVGLLLLSQKFGIAFPIILRAPLAIVDLGTAFLLGYVLRNTRYRWAAVGLYAIHPLAIILSAYHGNTDCLIAFLLLVSAAFISEEKPVLAAVALGVSLWIKLPGLMVAPALALSFRNWRNRFLFAAVTAITGVITFAPVLLKDFGILYARVFNYPGSILQTKAGVQVWGLQNFLGVFQLLPFDWQSSCVSAAFWFFQYNRIAVLIPLLVFAWLRRGDPHATYVGATITGSYTLVYALSNNWSFQYFAWSIPFWFMAGPVYFVLASLLGGAFIYALYAFDCGNLFLTGAWDFIGRPIWPRYLLTLRDCAVLFFFSSALVFLAAAIRRGNWGIVALRHFISSRKSSAV